MSLLRRLEHRGDSPPASPTTTTTPAGFVERASGLWARTQRLPLDHKVGHHDFSLARSITGAECARLARCSELAMVACEGVLFFDLETTGLGFGAGNLPFLVGVARFAGGELELVQFLLQSPGGEPEMLAALRPMFEQASMLVSFNGKSFDLPLLRTRQTVTNLLARAPNCQWSTPPHFDLLHSARRLYRYFEQQPGDCTLSALEQKELSFSRVNDIASEDIPKRYTQFLASGDSSTLDTIIEHNAFDVLAMVALLSSWVSRIRSSQADGRWLLGLAHSQTQSGHFDVAEQAITEALQTPLTPQNKATAHWLRGSVRKKNKQFKQAIDDFETISRESAQARLQLCILYEHVVGDARAALAVADLGTSEPAKHHAHRIRRLTKKAARPQQLCLPFATPFGTDSTCDN